MRRNVWTIATLVITLLMLGPGAARAEADDASFSDDTLRAYVRAYLEVRAIESRYADRLRDAFMRDEERELRRRREAAVKEAIEAAGLSPETYQRVRAAMETSAQLRRRVARQIVESRKSQ